MKFVIATRPYNPKSQGCVLLHKLTNTLNVVGYQATPVFFDGHGTETRWYLSDKKDFYCPHYIYKTFTDIKSFEKFKEGAIVIYPEIVSGNPLGGDYVVRYMLNREGFIKQGVLIQPSPNDFFLSHSYHYYNKPNFHLFNYNGDQLFNDQNTENFYKRKQDLTYIGKGSKYTTCFVIKNTTEITRTWPENKSELANLLKKSRYFYTWDSLSATTIDALLCGSFPIYMTHSPMTKKETFNLIDLGLTIPELTYAESLNELSDQKVIEINNFISSLKKKLHQSELEWKPKVQQFGRQVMNYFGLN